MVVDMRRIVLLSAMLFLSACAGRPVPTASTPAPVVEAPTVRSGLLGMTAGELIQRLGQPALQVREGSSVKLQFRGRVCVLDAYLYPSQPGSPERVTHIDTRLVSGADTDQAGCIASLDRA